MTEEQTRSVKKGDRIEVDISDAAEGEDCFGRLEDGLGVLVRGPVAVGDRVEAEAVRVRRRHVEARFVRLLTPSPRRVAPPCPWFGVCGGCKWQHVDYAEQLRLKHKIVADALQHLGGFADAAVRPVRPAPEPYGYRNKMEFSFADRRYLMPEEMDRPADTLDRPTDFALGFHAPARYSKALDIDQCLLGPPETRTVLDTVRRFCRERRLSVYSTLTHQGLLRSLVLRKARATGELMVNLVTSWHDAALMAALDAALREALGGGLTTLVNNITSRRNSSAFGEHEVVVSGPGVIAERLGPFRFTVSANSFFQTNTAQAEALAGEVMELARPAPGDMALDLYCGTGAFALFLDAAGASVLGIEAAESAVADAEANARTNGAARCRFRQMDLRDLGRLRDELTAAGPPRVAVTDPPRAGMHPKAVQALAALGAERIVYVACKPASLARDARALCDTGAYRLDEVRPVDMFPQTGHVECVARLVRTVDGRRSPDRTPAPGG